ncbi:MAG: hypothetical protein HKN67_07505 [Saprospiraceae bacterium]|nr:hypothetical protein [Saprospiraceae bacterium]
MRAFSENIDALEEKLAVLFQKWNKTNEERELLIKRNKQLEERLAENVYNQQAGEQSDSALDPTYITNAIDQYINRIDRCIERINMELDGE